MSKTSVFTGGPAAGFSRFYRELHAGDEIKRKKGPYLWQRRLAGELIEGQPPETLQAPTGTGKTTLIEVFLFALAWQLQSGERELPLRLFWVVDRRSVVDQVYRHATHAVGRINAASGSGILGEVRAALAPSDAGSAGSERQLDESVVECQRWRGATGLRPTTLRPDFPAVVCSTVDQVGSRLLFRGYGTSRGARPIDAALVGADSLIVIDEAHIAQPFVETVRAVSAVQERTAEHPGRPVRTMLMSATLAPENDTGKSFQLTDEELAEPALAKRVNTEKKVRVGRPARTRVSGLTAAAKELAQQPGLIGVVANTVGEARQVHTELSRSHEAWLLIGPNRPIFRDALIDAIPVRAERAEDRGPKLIVATQTIEVGVDLDFDAMVTACAPLDALAQRLGRLDRAGDVGETEAIVVHSKEPCPVYGEATVRAWALLSERATDGVVAMGPRQIDELLSGLSPEQRAEVTSPARRAPLLPPWQVEALSQTSEDPVPSPEVALFLHGDETLPTTEVNVIWRADLTTTDGSKPTGGWEARVEARPPHPEESIALPIGRVRAWLRRSVMVGRGDPNPIADVELGTIPEPSAPTDQKESPPPFVLVTPGQRAHAVETRLCWTPNEITPGATIVVPQSYGCCDEFGWIPEAEIEHNRSRPEDLGDLSSARPRLLFPPVLAPRQTPQSEQALISVTAVWHELGLSLDELSEPELYELLRAPILAWLRSVTTDAESQIPGPRSGLLQRTNALRRHIEESDAGTARVIGESEVDSPASTAEPTLVLVPDVRKSDFQRSHRSVTLADHSERVARHARQLASIVCNDDGIVRAVEIAAKYHDHGKLDPRFQRWMFLGEDPDPRQARAKSGISPSSHRSERAREAARWPRGKRHESLSALLLARSRLASSGEVDGELVSYLIAVHHGRNRPFLAPEDPDLDPVEVTAEIEGEPVTVSSSETLDWAKHASAFARLNDRYSPWGLALIEAALVQADWLASREEQEGR